MCIEMDASVLIQQHMPWRMFENETQNRNIILSLNIRDIFASLNYSEMILLLLLLLLLSLQGMVVLLL